MDESGVGDLATAAANWTLGRLRATEVQSLAIRLLEEGYASPGLFELAGTPAFALGRDLQTTVERAFADAGFVLPTREQAALLLTRQVAEDILDGRIEPYEGARRIWTLSYDVGDLNFSKVAIFVGFASEIEDHPESLASYEPKIVEEAGRLVRELH